MQNCYIQKAKSGIFKTEMRRGLGAAGVVKQRERNQKMTDLGEVINQSRAEEAKKHLDGFKQKLTEFAIKYRARIQADPVFREQFISMCDIVGVDPIQSSRNGSGGWIGGLLGINTFYSDLAIQVLTQCMIQRKSAYGPLLPLKKCMELVQCDNVSADDIRRALAGLECFGSGGVQVVTLGTELFVSSLPAEMSKDSHQVLSIFEAHVGLTCSEIAKRLSFPEERVLHAIEGLVKEGAIWEDTHNGTTRYWVLSLWLPANS